MTMRCRALVLGLIAALAVTSPAYADDAREDSRAAFRRGVAAIEKQDWATARNELEHAYELYPHPSILLDLGLARARTEAWVLAEKALVSFLTQDEGAAADEVETARRTLAEVKSHLGTMHLRVTPPSARVTVDGEPVAIADGKADVRLVLGEHRVHAEAIGWITQEQTVPVAAQGSDAEVSLVAVDEPAPSGGPTAAQIVGFSLIGAGTVSVGIGIFAGVRALDLSHQFNTVGEARYQDPTAKSTGVTFRTVADVTLIGGADLAAAGIVVLLVVPKPQRPAPALAFGVGTVALQLPF